MILVAMNEKHTACYNALVREQQRLMKCSQTYKTVYEQNEQMMNEMHGLITINVSLRQELERAYKMIESSHTQNVKLKTLLNDMIKTMNEINSVTELDRNHSTEELKTRIMMLKKRLKMKEKRCAKLLKIFDHTIVAKRNSQKFKKLYLSSIVFVWTNIYYMCLSKLSDLWRSSGLKFASKVALRCQALSLSKRLSL